MINSIKTERESSLNLIIDSMPEEIKSDNCRRKDLQKAATV